MHLPRRVTSFSSSAYASVDVRQIPAAAHHFQPQSRVEGALRAEVAHRTLQRVRGALQRFGITASDGLLNRRQQSRHLVEEQPDDFLQQFPIAVNPIQSRVAVKDRFGWRRLVWGAGFRCG